MVETKDVQRRISMACTVAFFFALVSAEQWEPIPMVSQAILDRGHYGGEGCQIPNAITVSSDGSFLLLGIDVGGIYRSINGGQMWQPANIGYTPRGCCGVAIDPRNKSRALAVGGNSSSWSWHGLYLTTDTAATWKSVYKQDYAGWRDYRDQLAYDESSFDATKGYCTVVYWSPSHGITGLHKSTNGGESWSKINDSYHDSEIKVHPTRGYVYVANSNGLYRSTNGGTAFSQIQSGAITGLDVVNTAPDRVFILKVDGAYISANSGESFTKVSGSLPSSPSKLAVSAVNTDHWVMESDPAGNWNCERWYSTNGGSSWQEATFDNTNAWAPFNNRSADFAWHPEQAGCLWSLGADWVTKSTDGGATYAWNSNGYSGIMIKGKWNFNVHNPDIVYMAAQDYNGGLTTDGGQTWKYINFSNHSWGGSCFSGYAASADVLFAVGEGRNSGTIQVSRSGGAEGSFSNTGITLSNSSRPSYGDPTNDQIVFCQNYRSTDQGRNWSSMSGVDAVYTHNPENPQELYGASGKSLVISTNHGQSWTNLAAINEDNDIQDVAYDWKRNRLYASIDKKIYKYDIGSGSPVDITGSMPADQHNSRNKYKTVAVDPVDPDIVYAGGNTNIYTTDAAVVRSTDAGNSWEILTRNVRNDNEKYGKDGGREASCIRVHPQTRYLWVSTGCFGVWKIGPPESGNTASQSPRRRISIGSGSQCIEGPVWVERYSLSGSLIEKYKMNSFTGKSPRRYSPTAAGLYIVKFYGARHNTMSEILRLEIHGRKGM
jgi:hypothetical protein